MPGGIVGELAVEQMSINVVELAQTTCLQGQGLRLGPPWTANGTNVVAAGLAIELADALLENLEDVVLEPLHIEEKSCDVEAVALGAVLEHIAALPRVACSLGRGRGFICVSIAIMAVVDT